MWNDVEQTEEVYRWLFSEEVNRIPFLDEIEENDYKKSSIKGYYDLLKRETNIRRLKGCDFNDQDRGSLHRAIKDKPLNLKRYN
ncbi:hypothetical protein BUY49_03790 [Staphylococcus devriesei]|uniref:hypothetical protein n=1 Tax=Staphylococcus devriesei TaxID=586733 RepID=UPI000E6835F6|nr:hypothetical protein [Staphylococcus devriesei]RIL72283.1 hypothetical protein BUY49_03790 [Staphylococcus devriesei]